MKQSLSTPRFSGRCVGLPVSFSDKDAPLGGNLVKQRILWILIKEAPVTTPFVNTSYNNSHSRSVRKEVLVFWARWGKGFKLAV